MSMKNPRYVSYDNTNHNGGTCKGADKPEKLANRETRVGTWNEDLTIQIGD
jgi:hypothetical protein